MRRSVIPALATLVAAASGCQAAAPVPPPASAPATAWSTPTPTAATPAAASPPLPPSPTASPPTVTCLSSAPPWKPPPFSVTDGWVLVQGTIYDEAGTPVEGAEVVVRSLDASVPYEWRVGPTCADGRWSVRNVPEGANVMITASRPGWASRRRVGSFQRQASGRRNVIDFGVSRDGRPNDEDGRGAAFFLTDRPEVALAEPGLDAKDVDPATIDVVLRISEPLDVAAQAALADALVVLPADEAAGGADAYAIRATSSFLAARRATTTWNAAGTELAFRLDAPLRTGREAGARYRVGVMASGAPILDAAGLPLGGAAAEDAPAASQPSQLLAGAFVANLYDIAMPSSADAAARWSATHRTTADFTVRPDGQPPALVAVTAYDEGADAVISLRFSEPMAAFDGTPDGWSDPTVLGRASGGEKIDDPGLAQRYTFRLSQAADDVDRDRLNGRNAREPIYDPRTGESPPLGVEFALLPPAVRFDGDLAKAAAGEVVLAVGPEDPHVLRFRFKGRAGLFAGAGAIGARAAGIADPAGNLVTDAEADRHAVASPRKTP